MQHYLALKQIVSAKVISQKIVRQKSMFTENSSNFTGIRKFLQQFCQFCKLLCTHLGKILNFCNMLLVAKYAPRKNLEKTHMCQIRAKIG